MARIVFAAAAGVVEVKLKIEGMMCGGCSGRVEETIQVCGRSLFCGRSAFPRPSLSLEVTMNASFRRRWTRS